jgi:hypothetical protein
MSVAKQVARILDARVEHKHAASTVGSQIAWATAGVVSLISTDVAQGDAIGQRSGDVIRPKRLVFRMTSTNSLATGLLYGRFIIFQDTQAYGATPAVNDVLESANYLAPHNVVNVQASRFKILHERLFTSVNAVETAIKEFKVVCNLKSTIHYLTPNAGSATAGKNTLYVLFISDSANAAKTYTWSYDLEYTDA